MLLSACAEFPMIASRQDIDELEKSMSEVKLQMDAVQRNQADLGVKIEELNVNLQAITGSLGEDIERVMKRIENLERKLTGSISATSQAPSSKMSAPKEIFDLAYQDYVKGNYSLAIMGFDEYLKRYPDSQFAAQAQYWKGECLFSQQKWTESMAEFERTITSFPDTPEVRKAKLKKAICLINLKQNDKALRLLGDIIEKYPLSPEALQAEERKKELKDQR